jgi:sterol desaturase/sphingolipid hydroxylase (fatty acid hydroxylase superfamily)
MEDTIFYFSHRALHTPRLYAAIHKLHHAYNHPVVSASEHAHVVEYLLGNMLPIIVPAIALRMHLATVAVFVAVRIAVSVDEHCGYAFPFSPVRLLPFQTSAGGHDYHHSHNVGMYASQFVFWDRLCRTDGAYMAHRAAKLGGKEA